ncbi:MAG: ABC transporter permease [Candidatus Cloacimonetes bacterium]|nr:ABC transporter permease [Candidatus Cloacimonadota bacterium]
MLKIISYFLLKYIASPQKEWRRFDSIFMVMGILLSVSTLTIALAIFEGYETVLKETILGANSHIYFFKNSNSDLNREDIEKIKSKLSEKIEVQSVSEAVVTNAMMINKKRIKGVVLRGINWQANEHPTEYKSFVRSGTYKLVSENDAVIGEKLAQILNATIGDSVELISPSNTKVTAFGMKNKKEKFKIVGIYSSGMYEYDSKYVFINLTKAMNFASLENEYTMMEVRLKSEFVEKADYLTYTWKNEFDHDYQIRSWIDYNSNLFALLQLEKWIIFIILSFLVLIASFNVISSVSSAILEKRKEIGIIKAFGASNLMLKNLFLGKTLIISFFAIIFGEILGIIFSILIENQSFFSLKGDVYFLEKINVAFVPLNIILTFLVSIIIVFLASMIPLRKITNQEISDVIH